MLYLTKRHGDFMIWENIKIINDGDNVGKDLVNYWEIEDYCDILNNSIKISFVGVVVKKEKILFSLPKHYEVDNITPNNYNVFKDILNLISLKKTNQGSFDSGVKGEFPLRAYIYVLNYYKKHGLFQGINTRNFYGYNGLIDWNKTIHKSNKIIQDNGIVFTPFVIKKTENMNVFLSECMNYILQDAVKYKGFITRIYPYKGIKIHNKFNNLVYIINKLKRIKSTFFKDEELKLIVNMIQYLEWKSVSKEKFNLLTLNFKDYWQEIVHFLISNAFDEYINGDIIWGNKKHNFKSEIAEYAESQAIRKSDDSKNRKNYKIRYDHIYVDDINRTIYLFDSKYFSEEVNDLNYKQLFYHYHLKQKYKDSCGSYEIVNGLIIPTSKKYFSKTHINRLDVDGIEIREHYINLENAIEFFLEANQ